MARRIRSVLSGLWMVWLGGPGLVESWSKWEKLLKDVVTSPYCGLHWCWQMHFKDQSRWVQWDQCIQCRHISLWEDNRELAKRTYRLTTRFGGIKRSSCCKKSTSHQGGMLPCSIWNKLDQLFLGQKNWSYIFIGSLENRYAENTREDRLQRSPCGSPHW